MTKNEIAYTTYRTAAQTVIELKAEIKALYKQAEAAGQDARRNTVGTFEEKLAAIKAATAPFIERIAQAEAEITQNYAIADENFDAWQGLK